MGNSSSSSSVPPLSGSSREGRNALSPNSSGSSMVNALSTLRKTAGNLGLSKNELDRRCKPNGLYGSCLWEDKAIRRCVGDGKLAARLPGSEEHTQSSQRECPICFFYHSQINVTTCCKACICTECYLQLRPQREKNVPCPFCTDSNFGILVAKNLNDKDVKKIAEEEKTLMEAQIRARKSKTQNESDFGKSLERHKNNKTKIESSNDDSSEFCIEPSVISLMTPDDRHFLEEEMKKQHLHPLTREMEREADELRREHDLSYRRSNRFNSRFGRDSSGYAASLHRSLLAHGRSRASQGRRRERDWNQIVEAFENHYGTGEVQSIDDLVVIEAAILLSMEEEAAQRRRLRRDHTNGEEDDFNPPTRGGFPLLHSLMSRRAQTSSEDDEEVANARSSRRNRTMRRGRAPGIDDASNILVRGMSEEDQIAMAIALSLRESDTSETNQDNAQTQSNSSRNTQNDTADTNSNRVTSNPNHS